MARQQAAVAEPWGQLVGSVPSVPEAEQLPLELDDGLSFGEWVMALPLSPASSTTVGEHHRAQHPEGAA